MTKHYFNNDVFIDEKVKSEYTKCNLKIENMQRIAFTPVTQSPSAGRITSILN